MSEGTDLPPTSARASDEERYDAEILAALMDGTVRLDQIDDKELGRLVRALGPDGLLATIADAPKLFDRTNPRVEAPPSPVKWSGAWLPALASAAVLLIVGGGTVAFFTSRSAEQVASQSESQPRPATGTGASAEPLGAAALSPIVLSARWSDAVDRPVEFRGPANSSPQPRSSGRIASIENGEITVDLGSLDGLEKGAPVALFGASGQDALGTLTITRVFRERAVGVANSADSLAVGDRAELSGVTRVLALADRAAAQAAAGNLDAARETAARAVSVGRSERLSADQAWHPLALLGTLEHRAGSLANAERNLRSAVEALPDDAGTEGADLLNEFGAVLLALEQDGEAEQVLNRARPRAEGGTAVYVANNLGAVAARRGDRATAAAMYRSALALAGASSALAAERRAIEENLRAVGTQ